MLLIIIILEVLDCLKHVLPWLREGLVLLISLCQDQLPIFGGVDGKELLGDQVPETRVLLVFLVLVLFKVHLGHPIKDRICCV
mmetsp:Transcript_606/g.654  ORF Transcript_606/g.654 Transcript_606/m.654 type:complete len:83 (-) Transcript_606:74-322(-)